MFAIIRTTSVASSQFPSVNSILDAMFSLLESLAMHVVYRGL